MVVEILGETFTNPKVLLNNRKRRFIIVKCEDENGDTKLK